MQERAGPGLAYLTTRDLQELIRVDKSTIYRMAEDGRIPAVKIGRQWRFPEAAVHEMLGRMPQSEPAPPGGEALIEALSPAATQAIADLAAQALEAMVVVTAMDGRPVSEVANPCGLFAALVAEPGVLPRCVDTWAGYGAVPDLTPAFRRSQFGFLCARSFIRVGNELLGMVIVGGIAPEVWPPDGSEIAEIANELGVGTGIVAEHIEEVFHLDGDAKQRILALLPRIAVVVSHMVGTASQFVNRLDAIASLAGDIETTRSAS